MAPVSSLHLRPFTLTVAGPAARVSAYLETLRSAAADQAGPDRLTLTATALGVDDPQVGTSRAWVTGLTSLFHVAAVAQLLGPTALESAAVVGSRALTRAAGGWPARPAAFYCSSSQALLVRANPGGVDAVDAVGVWHVTAGQLPVLYAGVYQFACAWARSPAASLTLTEELLLPVAMLGPASGDGTHAAQERDRLLVRAAEAGGWVAQFNAAYGVYYVNPGAVPLLAYLDAHPGALLGAGLALHTRWPSALAFAAAADALAAAGTPVGELAALRAVASALVCRGLSPSEAALIWSVLAAGGGRALSRVLAGADAQVMWPARAAVPLSDLLHACAGLSQARTG